MSDTPASTRRSSNGAEEGNCAVSVAGAIGLGADALGEKSFHNQRLLARSGTGIPVYRAEKTVQ